jgi:DNA-binding NtrC family response regulator
MMAAGSSNPTKMTASVPASAGKVLLIDDDDLIAGCLRQYLAQQGCAVDVALEQVTAERLMRGGAYRVIVVDPFFTGGVHGMSEGLLASIPLLQPEAEVMVVTGYGSSEMSRLTAAPRLSIHSKPQPVAALGELIFAALAAPARFPSHVATPSSQELNS